MFALLRGNICLAAKKQNTRNECLSGRCLGGRQKHCFRKKKKPCKSIRFARLLVLCLPMDGSGFARVLRSGRAYS